MDWQVKFGSHTKVISLPDGIPSGTEFEIKVDSKIVTVRWNRDTKNLFVKNDHGLWQSIALRSKEIIKNPDDDETLVNLEFLPPGSHRTAIVNATVGFHSPDGGEAHAKKSLLKNLLIRSQITGKVIRTHVKAGDAVNAGDTLLIVEAMKMENRVLATTNGLVEAIRVKEGDAVSAGQELVKLAPPSKT